MSLKCTVLWMCINTKKGINMEHVSTIHATNITCSNLLTPIWPWQGQN